MMMMHSQRGAAARLKCAESLPFDIHFSEMNKMMLSKKFLAIPEDTWFPF